jgi:hypothetical protein
LHELAEDVVDERRRRVALEREVRELRAQLAKFKARQPEHDARVARKRN